MKSRFLIHIVSIGFLASLAIVVQLAAQDADTPLKKAQHHHYKFIDLGTLGGPVSYFSGGGIGNLLLNNRGVVAGYADTSTPDPYAPNCFNADCFLSHTFRWQNGVLTDLGALPGTNSSAASGINARGWVAGYSENGEIDPLTGSPETNAVLWKDGQIINLGTLGGNESLAISVKDGGQVVGLATINAVPDPFSFLGAPTHTFTWKNGVMQDLGTLGGPDSFPSAGGINERNGLVAGQSYTNSTAELNSGPVWTECPNHGPLPLAERHNDRPGDTRRHLWFGGRGQQQRSSRRPIGSCRRLNGSPVSLGPGSAYGSGYPRRDFSPQLS